MQGQDYTLNYIGAQIKNWKILGKGIGGTVFNEPWFKKMQEDAFDIYLSQTEISKIYNLKLSGRYDIVRDWFVLDCYTGLRIGDLMILNSKNYSKGFITIANQKTGAKVVIPAHRYVRAILQKHGGFPPKVKDFDMNEKIKDIGEKAGIDDRVLFTITRGGRREDQYLKKFQMISNHTARRSFITNLLKTGVPDTIVMKLTGIKSAATLKRYDKLGTEEAAKIASRHRFFK